MAGVQADTDSTIGLQAANLVGELPTGSILFLMMSVADPSLYPVISLLVSKGTSVVPLLYDASHFETKQRVVSATNPEFMGALRDAGAVPSVMPVEMNLG